LSAQIALPGKRGAGAQSGRITRQSGGIYAETLSFFSASRACSIDFSHFDPMFRLNAALDRNAIPWFAARQRKTQLPAF
jgi:hypothetical protein